MYKSISDNLLSDLKAKVGECIDYGKLSTDEDIYEIVCRTVFEHSKEKYIPIQQKKHIIENIYNSIRKLDVLQPIIDDESIAEIMINRHDCLFVERNGRVSKVDMQIESRQKLEDIIQKVVSKVNRAVNESSPIVDARLSDGSRVCIVLPPVSLDGPTMTIRKFPYKPLTMQRLVEIGSISLEAANFLEKLVVAKFNIFISGGTGSGKTTFLNALSGFIPNDERIVTIEDSAELRINSTENIVRLETRNPNSEGIGEINISDLIRASLRMRPDRIIVGEVRGREAIDMLQAMNTGHDGSLSTGHANSCRDMLSRLETMILSGSSMPLAAIRQQIASAVDILIHLSRLRDKSRRITEIYQIEGIIDGEIKLNPLFVFEEIECKDSGMLIGELQRTTYAVLRGYKFKCAGIEVS